MEPSVQHTLQTVILISLFLGLFPTRSPFLKSKSFKFHWASVGTIIAVLALALSCLNTFGAIYSIRKNLRTEAQAFKLVLILTPALAMIYAVLARLAAIVFCSKLVSLIEIFGELQAIFSQDGYVNRRIRRWRSWFTVGFCLILGFTAVCHVWVHAVAVLTGDRSNPLTSVALRHEMHAVQKFLLIFGYSNPIVIEKITVALILCFGDHLLRIHEQMSYMLQHQLEASGTIVQFDWNGNDQKFSYSYLQAFGKLKTCFQIYTDVLGRQSLLILVETITMVTYSTYFMLWPTDGSINPLMLPAALLSPALMLWIGNSMEKQVRMHYTCFWTHFVYGTVYFLQVKERRQKIEDTLANVRMRRQEGPYEVF